MADDMVDLKVCAVSVVDRNRAPTGRMVEALKRWFAVDRATICALSSAEIDHIRADECMRVHVLPTAEAARHWEMLASDAETWAAKCKAQHEAAGPRAKLVRKAAIEHKARARGTPCTDLCEPSFTAIAAARGRPL